MKLSLQVASISPGNAKPGPAGLPGTGEFGTTMQASMATFLFARTSPDGNSQASTDIQSGLAKGLGTGQPEKISKGLAAQGTEMFVSPEEAQVGTAIPLAALDELMGPSESHEGQGTECTNTPAPTDEISTAPQAQGLVSEKLLVQTSLVRQQHLILDRGEEPQRPVAGTQSQLSPPTKDASSRTRHRAEEAEGRGDHPDADDPSSNVPLASQSAPIVVPVLVFHPGELKPAPVPGSSDAKSSHVDLYDASHRLPTLSAPVVGGEPQDGPNTVSESAMVKQPQMTVAAIGDQSIEALSPNAKSRHSTNEQLVPVIGGRTYSDFATPGSQDRHPQTAIHPEFVNNASLIDTHFQKANERKSGTEQELQIAAIGSRHVTPPPVTEHQAAAHVPELVFHAPPRTIDVHRPQVSGAQVLQRMDMVAPSGAIQMRAETRRLEVGVSSGELGWVEVRATSAASGRVDATLQVQNDSSAHVLASQSREIADYARQHSVFLGELSVGVGTGDGARRDSNSPHSEERNGNAIQVREPRPLVNNELTYRPTETVSFISVRA